MPAARRVRARQIINSRGLPTVEVDLFLDGLTFRGSTPSGASTGGCEAAPLLDGTPEHDGHSVHQAVRLVQQLGTRLLASQAASLDEVDSMTSFDSALGTPNCTGAPENIDVTQHAGSTGSIRDGTSSTPSIPPSTPPASPRSPYNVTLPLSIAFSKYFAHSAGRPLWHWLATLSHSTPSLPIPCFNLLNGGLHSGNGLWCQELMVSFPSAHSVAASLELACALFTRLKETVAVRYGSVFASAVGEEGGLCPPVQGLEEAIEMVVEAHGRLSRERGTGVPPVAVMIDAAANTFKRGIYYEVEGKRLSGGELAEFYAGLAERHPELVSIEDPFGEEDLEAWECMARGCGSARAGEGGRPTQASKEDRSIEGSGDDRPTPIGKEDRSIEGSGDEFTQTDKSQSSKEDHHKGEKETGRVRSVSIVADDLTVTDAERIERLLELGAPGSRSVPLFDTVIIKPNQIGTVSGCIRASRAARRGGCRLMVSHRSGETEDVFVAHLAVGLGAEYVKCGAPCRGERVGKYNELLRIEEEMGEQEEGL